MEIGIVGVGVVGNAFSKMLVVQGYSVKKLDIYKNYFDDIGKSDIVFICINETDKEMTNIKSVVKEVVKKNQKGIIVIRTTVIPGTIDKFIELYPERKIAYLPEFLTERSAEFDELHPDKIIVGTKDKKVFETMRGIFEGIINHQRIIQMKPIEAEIVKVALNSLYVVKVIFAEEINELAGQYKADYKEIYKAFCLDRYTNKEHLIAGKDGYSGADGKCLPKDIGLLCEAGKKTTSSLILIEIARQLNIHYLKQRGKGNG